MKLRLKVGKKFLRALYVLSHSGKPSCEDELASAKTFDLNYLKEGVSRAELFLHVPPRLVSNETRLCLGIRPWSTSKAQSPNSCTTRPACCWKQAQLRAWPLR